MECDVDLESQIQSTGMECDVDLEISNSIHNAIDAWDFEGAYNITYLSKSCFIFGQINHPLKYNNKKVLEHKFFRPVMDH